MSILNRLNLLIRSNLNDALNSRNDTSLRSAFAEMESSLRDARRQQIELKAGEKRLIAQIRTAREHADQWEDRAILALRHGDEELAREALIVKNRSLREAERLRDQLDDHRAYMRDIASALEALEMKLESTRGRMKAIAYGQGPSSSSRPASFRNEADWDAELRRRVEGNPAGGSDGHATRSTSSRPQGANAPRATPAPPVDSDFDLHREMGEFDRMASKIDSMEAEIDAIRELGMGGDDLIDPRRAELEGIFRKMEDRRQTRDDLADLKKKFED
jgi:phage shock protein A